MFGTVVNGVTAVTVVTAAGLGAGGAGTVMGWTLFGAGVVAVVVTLAGPSVARLIGGFVGSRVSGALDSAVEGVGACGEGVVTTGGRVVVGGAEVDGGATEGTAEVGVGRVPEGSVTTVAPAIASPIADTR
jgi:hypothetical protein